MEPTLESVYTKLKRADQQQKALRRSVKRWDQGDGLGIDLERDGQRVWVRVKNVPEVPVEWHVRIGEAVHNLRSALDHLAYALNSVGSGNPPPNLDTSQFPIFDEGGKYRHSSPKMVRCMPLSAIAEIERLQPYHREDDPETWWLAILAALSSIDKHHPFPIAIATMPDLDVTIRVPQEWIVDQKLTTGPVKDGAAVAWYDIPRLPPTAEPDVEVRCALSVELEQGLPPEGVPLDLAYESPTLVLSEIGKFIRGRVLPVLEPFFS